MGEYSPPTTADYAQAAANSAQRSLDQLVGRVERLEEERGGIIPVMSLRTYFAANAPVDAKMALAVWGRDSQGKGPPSDDKARAAFMAVWAMLRYEYADAMLEERGK